MTTRTGWAAIASSRATWISKYLAGRPKDLHFCAGIVRAGVVRESVLLDRLQHTRCAPEEAGAARARICRDFADLDRAGPPSAGRAGTEG